MTLVARPVGPLEELAAELGGVAIVADLVDPAGRDELIARAEEQAGLGRFYRAGGSSPAPRPRRSAGPP